MSARPPLEPAPARGCYDRGLPRSARQAEQRERLTHWIAEVYRQKGEALTVQDLIENAGVGRNTFYEYFDGLEHALEHASHTWVKQLYEIMVSEVELARSPIARLRALSKAWFEQVEEQPAAISLLLRRPPDRAMSAAAELFRRLLQQALVPSAVGPALRSEPGWEVCAACAAEGASLVALRAAAPTSELEDALSVTLTRVFR